MNAEPDNPDTPAARHAAAVAELNERLHERTQGGIAAERRVLEELRLERKRCGDYRKENTALQRALAALKARHLAVIDGLLQWRGEVARHSRAAVEPETVERRLNDLLLTEPEGEGVPAAALVAALKDKTGMKSRAGRCDLCADPGNYPKVRHDVCEPCWNQMVWIVEAELKKLAAPEPEPAAEVPVTAPDTDPRDWRWTEDAAGNPVPEAKGKEGADHGL